MLKQIPRYTNYYLTTEGKKRIFGLDADESTAKLDIIDIIDQDGDELNLVDFFTKNNDLYFVIEETSIQETEPGSETATTTKNEICYKQDSNDNVTEVTKPTRPTLNRVQLENGVFSIKNFDYNGKLCSDVDNLTLECGFERFFMVDGFSYFDNAGIFINVSDGRYNDKIVVRKEGLYFWPTNSGRCSLMKLPKGEIW